jgi:hypothetical protein
MSIKDNPYFKIVKPVEVAPQVRDLNVVLEGNAWLVRFKNDQYILEYISGEHAGREKFIIITEQEFFGLRDEDLTVDQVLSAHDAY